MSARRAWKIGPRRLGFMCPGCKVNHVVTVEGPGSWQWNGDLDRPTISPSIKVTLPDAAGSICHSFVEGGRIRFLADCHHDLAGQVVDLPEDQ